LDKGPNCKGKIIPTTIFFPKGKKMETICNIEDVIQGRRGLLKKNLNPTSSTQITYSHHCIIIQIQRKKNLMKYLSIWHLFCNCIKLNITCCSCLVLTNGTIYSQEWHVS
jgi:hypothetical protein